MEDYSFVLLMDDVQEKNIIQDGGGSIALFIVCVCVCVCVCVDKSQGMTHDAPTKCYTQKKVILPGRPRQLFENLSPYTRTTFKKGLPLLIHWRIDEDTNFHHFKCLSNSIRRKRVSPLQASCPSINLFSRCVKALV